MQEDFREQVEDWEEFQELTVSQRERLLASSDFTRRLLAQLRSSSAYQETYWEAVPEVAAALLTEISRQPDTDKRDEQNGRKKLPANRQMGIERAWGISRAQKP